MLCEIINPSDSYTLRTDDFTLAGVAVAILGNGQWGLRSLETDDATPVLFGWDEWFDANGVKLSEYVAVNRERIADVLDTVLIGGASDRELAEAALAHMPEESRRDWLAKRHDAKRSSMNDIGAHAHKLADHLRKVEAEANAA